MIQTNKSYSTKRLVRRRPRFLSSANVQDIRTRCVPPRGRTASLFAFREVKCLGPVAQMVLKLFLLVYHPYDFFLTKYSLHKTFSAEKKINRTWIIHYFWQRKVEHWKGHVSTTFPFSRAGATGGAGSSAGVVATGGGERTSPPQGKAERLFVIFTFVVTMCFFPICQFPTQWYDW